MGLQIAAGVSETDRCCAYAVVSYVGYTKKADGDKIIDCWWWDRCDNHRDRHVSASAASILTHCGLSWTMPCYLRHSYAF